MGQIYKKEKNKSMEISNWSDFDSIYHRNVCKKDLIYIDVTMSLPLIITSSAVTLLKVTAIVIVVLFVKWFTNKIKK